MTEKEYAPGECQGAEGDSQENNATNADNAQGGSGIKPLPVLTFQELLQKEIPERAKLLPWLPEGGLVMIDAPAGCGKTYAAQTLCVAMASGSDFFKWKVTKAVPVLYIDGEMAQGDFRTRWNMLTKDKNRICEIYTLSHEDFFEQEQKDLNLADNNQQERLKATIERYPSIKVVVIDNLSCLLPTLREDKRDDWVRHVLPLLIWLRRRGVAVAFLHHTGKGGDQRGTVAKLDALNTSITLKPLEKEDSKAGAAFELHFRKSRDCHGDDIEPLTCHLDKDTGQWTWEPLEQTSEERLLALVEENGGEMQGSEAAEAMNVSPSRISHLKSTLIKAGRLKKHKLLKLVETNVDDNVDG